MTQISGVITLRNAEEVGYPYVTSILSVLPITDEFLINDGRSDDGTREALEVLSESFERITLYDIPDNGPSSRWDAIDAQLNKLMDEADGEWIIESQCDEVWPRPTLNRVEELMRSNGKFNSIRQPRIVAHDLRVQEVPEYIYETVRCVRNLDEVTSRSGGDSFMLGERKAPKDGYTSHNVPPEKEINDGFYHLRDFEMLEHSRRHAKWLATDSEARQRVLEDKKELRDDRG